MLVLDHMPLTVYCTEINVGMSQNLTLVYVLFYSSDSVNDSNLARIKIVYNFLEFPFGVSCAVSIHLRQEPVVAAPTEGNSKVRGSQ